MNGDTVNQGWLLVCAGLVFLMQAGFACLESGLARPKNNADVAVTNFADFLVSSLLYWALGYAFMYGPTWGGFVGTAGFGYDGSGRIGNEAFFVFQMMFCATAATIVCGAVAERMKYGQYLAGTVVIAALIYPVAGHWVWGSAVAGQQGWLKSIGFLDFAGSTVVHSVGGWCALATLLVLGPRRGRFGGRPFAIQSGGVPFAVLGTLLLYFGWIGFNAGSALVLDGNSGRIVVDTMLAGAAGGLAVLVVGLVKPKLATVIDLLNGSLAGLVAITASANVAAPGAAVVVGAIGGLVALAGRHLLDLLEIDDAVGAIPVHLFAGIWGTIAVALVTPFAQLPAGHTLYGQLYVQVAGIGAVGAWTFGVAYLTMRLLDALFGLRVDAEAERRGLNLAVHGILTEMAVLTGRLGLYRKTADLVDLYDAAETDIGDVARDFNRAVDRFRSELTRTRHRLRDGTGGEAAPARHRLRAIEREEDELRIAAEEVNLVADQLAQAAPLVSTVIAPKDRFVRVLQATFEGPIRDLADLERRMRTERDDAVIEAIIETARERSAVLARKLATFVEFTDAATADAPPLAAELDLRTLVSEIVADFMPRAAAANVMIAWSVADEAARIVGHPSSLRRMLRKLVDNAVRFNQDGGLVEIAATAEAGDMVRLVVSDTGCGMNAGRIRAALHPFAESDPAPEARPGVGLALVARLAQMHGGRFDLSSKPGIGTRAEIVLPRGAVAARAGAGA